MKRLFRRAAMWGATAALALGAASANATVYSNVLVFNDVTWTTTFDDATAERADRPTFTNALNATGNWANINWLWALEVKPVGTVDTATIAPSGTFSPDQLNAHGCSGGALG